MEKLEFDRRNKEEILEQISKKAMSYVPEWRFDTKKPDIGTALAMVYGQMLLGTVKKINFLPYKNQISFFNELEAVLLPAVPSKGYVTFSVVNNEVEGVEVPAGMEVLAQAKNADMETVSFETLDDIFVTPAELSCMLQVSKEKDFIGNLYHLGEKDMEIVPFSYEGTNLQEHSFYFCHDDALSIKRTGKIAIQFLLHEDKIPMEYIEAFEDTSNVVFEYGTEQGYEPFPTIERSGKQLLFTLEKNGLPFALREENGIESFWIRCKAKDITPFKKFSFDCLEISTSCKRMMPDSIYANGSEIRKEEFFPFGERFSDYNEVYLSSDEVFGKKGSLVTITFNLDFVKIPLDYVDKTSMEWEWIMKKSDFKPDMDYDVTIEEVVWEYYNGYGWTVLFDKNEYSDIFSSKNGTMGQYKTMSFVCPKDIEPILINAQEALYIRARVTKVNNLYKMQGNFISPIMDNIFLQYKYQDSPVEPKVLFTENNKEQEKYKFYCKENRERIIPFYGLTEEVQTLYLGFDIPPVGGPIKILFDFLEQLDRKNQTLLWEYYNGERWKEPDVVDETENMSKTGLVTLMGNEDFAKLKVYGYEKYWLRILDVSEHYKKGNEEIKLPCLKGIYMNSVKVRQKEREETEYFHMEVYQKNMRFPLLYGKIFESTVYVDELGHLSKGELDDLLRGHKLFPEYREDGEMERAWVKWSYRKDLLSSESEDRHYTLNRNEGSIQFGDGRTGKIPPASKTDNIKVIYKTGGGEYTNVPAGAITQLGTYIGFINDVCNHKMLIGGSDTETLTEALNRNAATLRHQNMAITRKDFEEIAKAASRSIKKVKCFSGYDDRERKQSGAITLVVLQKELWQGRTRFHDIKLEVENYMKDKMNNSLLAQNRFFIIEPKFVQLHVRVEIMVESFHEVFHIKKQVLEKLEDFINPLTGNFDGTGWKIGTLPNNLQLKNAISDVQGILYIKNIYVNACCNENGIMKEVDLEKIKQSKYILPVNGEHDVIMKVS